MTSLAEIKEAIQNLPPADFAENGPVVQRSARRPLGPTNRGRCICRPSRLLQRTGRPGPGSRRRERSIAHRTIPEFWEHLAALPKPVQQVARRNFQRLKENPAYPSLRLKKVGDYWVARVGSNYRALAVTEGADLFWVWIGTHDAYERIINS